MEATRHEVEVDTRIADAYEAAAAARQKLNAAQKHLDWVLKNGRSFEEERAECVRDSLHVVFTDLIEKCWLLDAEYEGWSRFFIVKNTNGHIHSSMDCSTCYPTTVFGWLPQLSGLTEADAVEEWGGILCSVCFPSAPVEWTEGTNKKEAAEKDLHKALVAIERSAEGKKIKALKSSLSSKVYSRDSRQRELDRIHEDRDGGYEPAAWLLAKEANLPTEIAKIDKQIAAYEAKLAKAEKALEEALNS